MPIAVDEQQASQYVAKERRELDMVFHFNHINFDNTNGDKWKPKKWELPELEEKLRESLATAYARKPRYFPSQRRVFQLLIVLPVGVQAQDIKITTHLEIPAAQRLKEVASPNLRTVSELRMIRMLVPDKEEMSLEAKSRFVSELLSTLNNG
jgi:hypothetical protein